VGDRTGAPVEMGDDTSSYPTGPLGFPMSRSVRTSIAIRPYSEADEPAVLELLHASLGPGPVGERNPEFFRWKHKANPFGPSYMLVAEVAGRIVGLRSFMRWRFVSDGRVVRAVRAVDTATHPEFQRMGIFSRLTKQAVEDLRLQTDLVFNTPNSRSGPGYLKLGWHRVGRVTVSVHVRRPIRFIGRLRSMGDPSSDISIPVDLESARDCLADVDALSSLLEEAAAPTGQLATQKDLTFLRWRYGGTALLDYRAVRELRHGRLEGLAILRVRPRGRLWECSIVDLIARRGDTRTVIRLLQRAAAAAPVDYAVTRVASGWDAARAGYVPTPGPLTLVVNPLRGKILPDPTVRRSWALTLGDLEVF
jgi:hypothetical protein